MTRRWLSLFTIATIAVAVGAASYLAVTCPAGVPPPPPTTLHFTSDDASLSAELLPLHADEPLRPIFRVQDSEPLTVPAGSYRLRLSAPDRLSETLLVDAVSGRNEPLPVKLEDAALWPSLPLPRGGEVVEIDGRNDVMQFTNTGVRRLHGATAKTLWEVDLEAAALLTKAHLRWRDFLPEADDTRSPLARTPVDLDGDGTRDLLWLNRSTPALLAQSGYDGEPLWAYRGGDEGRVDGDPLTFQRDGKAVLLVTFRTAAHRWLDALAGDTGRRLWHADLESAKDEDACYAVTVTQRGGKAIISVISGGVLVELEATTGKRLGEPLPLEQSSEESLVCAQFVDLGDGVEDWLLLRCGVGDCALVAVSPATRETLWERRLANAKPAERPLVQREADRTVTILVQNGSTDKECVLEALDGKTGQPRWQRRLPTAAPSQRAQVVLGPDLDGDGRREVFVATIALPHWHNGEPHVYLFLDALSGKDGTTRWTTKLRRRDPQRGTSVVANKVQELSWWQTDADGWPQLLVPLSFDGSGAPETLTYVVSAGSGRVVNVLRGAEGARSADFDGDGVPDLYWFVNTDTGRELHTARGALPEAWRRLGEWRPVGELNGVTAFAHTSSGQAGTAVISARDGHVLFETELPGVSHLAALTVPPGDLAGDGVASLVGSDGKRFVALSGKTGKTLWSVPLPENGTQGGQSLRGLRLIGCDSARGRGDPTVLLDARLSTTAPEKQSAGTGRRWLVALAGKDGSLRWQHDLGALPPASADVDLPVTLADLNFDGYPDMLVWAVGADAHWELRAVNGRDGKTLWTRRFSFDVNTRPAATLPVVALSHLSELVGPALVLQDVAYQDGTTFVEVVALEPSNGEPKWAWRSGAGATLRNEQLPVTVILDGRTPSLCLLTATGPKSANLIVLDDNGKLRKQVPLEDATNTRLWPVRLNAQQTMGLACNSVEGGGLLNLLRVLGAGETALWQWRPDKVLEPVEIVDVASAQVNGPATLLVRMGGWYHGVAAVNGQVQWRTKQRPTLVPACSNNEQPHLVLRTETATVCRIASRTPERVAARLDVPVQSQLERFGEIVALYHLDWAAVMMLGAVFVTALVNRRWLLAVSAAVSPTAGYAGLLWYSRQTPAAEHDPRMMAEQVTASLGSQATTVGAAVLLAGLSLWGAWRLLCRFGPRLAAHVRPGRGW